MRELARGVWREYGEDEVRPRAFALYPSLLFPTALLGMLPVPGLMERLMGDVEQALPGDAASVIDKTLGEVMRGSLGSLLSIGAVAAPWASSNRRGSLMNALNVAYDVEAARPWWKRRLIALALTA